MIHLDEAIKSLELNPEKSINAMLLCKTEGISTTLIALKENAELKRHIAPGPISVQVLKGSISFRTDQKSQELSIGGLLLLEKEVPHSVFAHETSVFLVTKSIPTD